ATFVSLKTQPSDTTSAIGAWFDYRLKNKSNIQRKILSVIDAMCMAGRAPLKIYWDFDKKELCFVAVPPTFFIVPNDTEELDDAIWCCHVMAMSEEQYKKNPNFPNQDQTFIDKIKGGTSSEAGIGALDSKFDTIKRREGITFTKRTEQIVLWEVHRKEKNDVTFETYSPNMLEEKDAVRPRESLPYNHGCYPFISLRSEIKDEGWY